jgi:hypothetical protein
MQKNTKWIGLHTAILLMIATAVSGAAPAKQDQNPSQAGNSSIYFYDVAASDTHGKGKLMIDLAKHTFEFNGQDFEPSAQIALRAKAADSADYVLFATGKPTPSGNLHISGTWEADASPAEVVADTYYGPRRGFSFTNEGGFVARLSCYYSTDGCVTWQDSVQIKGITLNEHVWFDFYDLGVPMGALAKIHIDVVAGKDRTGSEVVESWNSGAYEDYVITGTTWNPKLQCYGWVFR